MGDARAVGTGQAATEAAEPHQHADLLGRMYAAQRSVMDEIGAGRAGYPHDTEGRVSSLCTAIIQEAAELQNTTGWKWWKKNNKSTARHFNEAHAREELADIFHFAVQAAIVLGMEPADLVAEYERKAAVNVRRQREGY